MVCERRVAVAAALNIPYGEGGRRQGAAIRAAQTREYFRIALDYNPLFLKNFFSCAPPDFLSLP
jgi:hypothetical protein